MVKQDETRLDKATLKYKLSKVYANTGEPGISYFVL